MEGSACASAPTAKLAGARRGGRPDNVNQYWSVQTAGGAFGPHMGSKPMSTRLRRFGFTLIELLVVIAIMALLISLLLPMLQRANELARSALCASNQRNIAIAFQAYYGDNDCLPGTWGYWPDKSPDFPKGGYPYDSWAEYLNSYLSAGPVGKTPGGKTCVWKISAMTWNMVTCPTDIRRTGLTGFGNFGLPRSEYVYRISYGMNSSLIYPNAYPPGKRFTMPSGGIQASRALLMDAGDSLMWYGNTKEYLSMTNGHTVWARHSLGMNILWLDGHVEWRSKSSMHTRDLNPNVNGAPFVDDAALYNSY